MYHVLQTSLLPAPLHNAPNVLCLWGQLIIVICKQDGLQKNFGAMQTGWSAWRQFFVRETKFCKGALDAQSSLPVCKAQQNNLGVSMCFCELLLHHVTDQRLPRSLDLTVQSLASRVEQYYADPASPKVADQVDLSMRSWLVNRP